MSGALKGLLFFGRFANSFSRLGYRQRKLFWRDESLDFDGERWLVTGATGGIGRAITERAVSAGATVTALARNEQKLGQLVGELGEGVEPRKVDLSLVGEIDRVLDELGSEDTGPFDVLLNNVGVLLNEHSLSDEGFEVSFATNLLNHYLLTEGLLDRGLMKPGSAVINMSSGGMYNVPLKVKALNAAEPAGYNGVTAYAFHKRAQVVLTDWWQQKYAGSGPSFYVMHPGWVDTEGVRTSLPGFRALFKHVLRDAEEGADTALWLASDRPAQPAGEAIWFDRARRPAHLSGDTRETSDPADDLVRFLDACAASARDPATS